MQLRRKCGTPTQDTDDAYVIQAIFGSAKYCNKSNARPNNLRERRDVVKEAATGVRHNREGVETKARCRETNNNLNKRSITKPSKATFYPRCTSDRVGAPDRRHGVGAASNSGAIRLVESCFVLPEGVQLPLGD